MTVLPGASIATAGTPVAISSFRALAWTYGLAHGGKTLFWTASDLYFTFYMTEVCAVSPARTGAVIGCSFLFAALADLVLVRIVTGRIGKRISPARMQAIGAVASAGALLVFAGVAFAPSGVRLGACIVALFAFRAAYSLFDVPQNALLALATDTDHQRAYLTAIRNMTGATARTLLAFAFVPVMTGHTAILAGTRFLALVLLLSIVTIAGALRLARIAAGRRAPPSGSGMRRAGGVPSLVAMMFVMTLATTIFSQIEPYLAAYGIADRLSAGGFMGLIAIGSAVSQPVWLARSVGRHPAALLRQALGLMAVGGICLATLPRDTLLGSGSAGFLYGIGSGGVMFALWSSVARYASRGAAIAIIGYFTACAKLGQGIAVIGAGMLMEGWLLRTDGDALAMMMSGAVVIGGAVVGGLSAIERGQRRYPNITSVSN